jgi:cell wall-associated NlpC family hydrolase
VESSLHLVKDLIGIPFRDGGRDISGLDCLGLAILVASRIGKQLPDFRISCKEPGKISDAVAMVRATMSFRRVQVPRFGDLVAIKADPRIPDIIQHFGIYLEGDRFIHVTPSQGVIITRIEGSWKRRLEGIYRW